MRKNILSAIVAIAAVVALTVDFPAKAQGPNCGDEADLNTFLTKEHGESVKYYGLMELDETRSAPFMIFVNSKTGTWTYVTLVQMGDADKACVLASGTKWTIKTN